MSNQVGNRAARTKRIGVEYKAQQQNWQRANDARIAGYLNNPRKEDLRNMLAEAARNTAKLKAPAT